ncbi:hypothetical protein WEN_00450 [Mycoplasma wenyonii str. Massachusetts]|uniref:Uncharacterized protein n=1 Tax=Mycoplasma wenyonii (strain Massachusetts) TaxID=1197325 RepID=I6ZEA1_MYCWM|nr:hypothetical protein [Mycoplasma wenyonii]AFN64897.1 hypothetical protein WEN_00450 [Mycoplasma wenyonii str. Massachusetts]
MGSDPKFSELAQQAITTYYQEFAGSLQNSSHSKALFYLQKIEKLRSNFFHYLGLENFLLSLQPNTHYLERLITEFLSTQSNQWEVFSGRELALKNASFHSLKEFLSLKKLQAPTFVLIDSDSPELPLISEQINYLKSQSPNLSIYSYLSSASLNQLKNGSLSEFSFISYDPSRELSEFGTVFFCFQQKLKLKPLFLGSGGAKFNHNSNELQLRELPYLLEIGTQNLVSWVVLAEYFESLALDSIKNVR